MTKTISTPCSSNQAAAMEQPGIYIVRAKDAQGETRGADFVSADELVGALDFLGVHFLAGGEGIESVSTLSPARLLAALAEQADARLRLAIVPLLLCRPELARAIPEATAYLVEPALTTLKLFYTAAVLLQQEYASKLQPLLGQREPLPDLFSEELGGASVDGTQVRLKWLGERHRALSGLAANWTGTYRHAAERLVKRLQWEAQWET